MERKKLIKTLAQRFVERAETLDLKGKKRDDAALHYFVGAAVLAQEAGHQELAQHLGTVCSLVLSVRGYFGVKELAAERDGPQT